jgi:hypothetical protein
MDQDAPRPQEVLVVVDADSGEPAQAAVGERLRVVQQLPPRVLLGTGSESAIAQVAELPGVSAVVRRDAAPLPPDLTAEERLFAGAWRSRGTEKHRPGDGLNWDAPGFTAPG